MKTRPFIYNLDTATVPHTININKITAVTVDAHRSVSDTLTLYNELYEVIRSELEAYIMDQTTTIRIAIFMYYILSLRSWINMSDDGYHIPINPTHLPACVIRL
uniref:Uncharacterized protein n=1 Tax=Steinernema glaseri TaxID=37863 RepID=A0A1I7YI43_9BILA